MEAGTTPADVANAIGPGLAKAAIAARVDGEVRDLNRPFEGNASLELITSRDEAVALELARHDLHVLAEAVQALWPGTQITLVQLLMMAFTMMLWPCSDHHLV